MSRKLDLAVTVSLAVTLTFALLSTSESVASAKDRAPQKPEIVQNLAPGAVVDETALSPSSSPAILADTPQVETADDESSVVPEAETLAEMVAAQSTSAPLSRELNCLAGAIYFESKSEPLNGQLAVGRVVIARARSGRFPNSYCGVVYQPSQFSFVRGNAMPAINTASRGWKNAVAIAQIAHEGSWQSPVEGALFFHATRVSPGWRLARMARVGNHVFYR